MKKITTLISILFSLQSQASSTIFDTELDGYIKRFKFKAVAKVSHKDDSLYQLGKSLFNDKRVSGENNISCASCHQAENFSTDLIPLPIGVGGIHEGRASQVINNSPIIPRNSPHLFNLKNADFMFWDGRVSYSRANHVFLTPEPGLNGLNPKLAYITKNLTGALSAQALFPPLSTEEMRGNNNPFANTKTNEETWKLIMSRLLAYEFYQEMFKASFPKFTNFNIGHFGAAIAHYIEIKFTVYDTPWDEYLRGDKNALSIDEKKGAIAFVKNGLCANCHSGQMLGGDSFHNIVSPQIGPGKSPDHDDKGLYELTKDDRHKYKFKTPSLRNTALTAPYFHSGAFKNLEDVIEHYEGGINAIDKYDSSWLKDLEDNNYFQKLFVETDPNMILDKKLTVHPILRRNFINFNKTQRKNVILFLKKSLTSKTFLNEN